MRSVIVAGLLAALVGCGTERSRPGFTTGPGTIGSNSATLTLRVVDDPAGAVNVISAASRPTVSIVFEATGQGTTAFQFTGAGQIQMTVPLDSSQTTMVLDLRNNAGTLVIDLNSAQWLRTIANPPPGEPAYAFDGAGAFLNAIAVRTQ